MARGALPFGVHDRDQASPQHAHATCHHLGQAAVRAPAPSLLNGAHVRDRGLGATVGPVETRVPWPI
jgi:hypothetical protein